MRGVTGLAFAALSRWALRRSTSSCGGRTCSAEVGSRSLNGWLLCLAGAEVLAGPGVPADPAASAGPGASAGLGAPASPEFSAGSTPASAALRSARLSGCADALRFASDASSDGLVPRPVRVLPEPEAFIQENAGSSGLSWSGSGCGSARLAGVEELSFTAASLPLGSAPRLWSGQRQVSVDEPTVRSLGTARCHTPRPRIQAAISV